MSHHNFEASSRFDSYTFCLLQHWVDDFLFLISVFLTEVMFVPHLGTSVERGVPSVDRTALAMPFVIVFFFVFKVLHRKGLKDSIYCIV